MWFFDEKSHQNLSDYIQFFIKKKLNLIEKKIIFCEKKRNSSNYIYDYAHLFYEKDF